MSAPQCANNKQNSNEVFIYLSALNIENYEANTLKDTFVIGQQLINSKL